MRRSTLVLTMSLAVALLATRWVRLNLSPSLPSGFYRLAPLAMPLTRGTLVVLPVPASVQPWHWWFTPLLKPIAAVAGETVCHRHHTLFINGADFGPVYATAYGKPLPQIAAGCVVVPAGHVFLASPAPRSLDGRYLGATPIATLTAQATPLLTWR